MKDTEKQINSILKRLGNYECEGQLKFNFDSQELQIEDTEIEEMERE